VLTATIPEFCTSLALSVQTKEVKDTFHILIATRQSQLCVYDVDLIYPSP
jgi:hypothetical protein